jgi:hypothetical protein
MIDIVVLRRRAMCQFRGQSSQDVVRAASVPVMPMVRLSRIGRLCGVLTVTLGKKA